MSDSEVLIIGASVRAAAASARRAGYGVVAADLFGDTDLIEVAEFHPISEYPAGFREIVRGCSLPVLYTGGLENAPELLDEVQTLWGNRGRALRIARDPFQWTPLLNEVGRTARVERPEWVREEPFSWLRKPLAGAGGGGIRPATEPTGDTASFLQERVDGPAVSAVFLTSAEACELLGVSRQLIGLRGLNAGPFAYCGSIGPIRLPSATGQQLDRIGNVLSRGIGLRGLVGVDGVMSADDFVPVEINPRYTASVEVLENAQDVSLLRRHMSVFAGQPLLTAETPDSPCAVVKLILYAPEELRFPDARSIGRQGSAWLADIPQVGTLIPRGAPVCSVLARAGSFVEAIRAAVGLAGELNGLVRQDVTDPSLLLDELCAAVDDIADGS